MKTLLLTLCCFAVALAGQAAVVTNDPVFDVWQWRYPSDADASYTYTYSDGLYLATSSRRVGNTAFSVSVLISTNGETWNPRYIQTSVDLSGITHGDGIIVAVGTSVTNNRATILTSEDGSTWAEQQVGTNQVLASVTYGSGQFVAVGHRWTVAGMPPKLNVEALVLTSANARDWIRQNPASTNRLTSVGFENGQFVAKGETVLTSPDGVTWTDQGPSLFTSTNAYGNGRQVRVDGGFILSSTNGLDWQPSGVGLVPCGSNYSSSYSSVAFNRGVFVVVGSGSYCHDGECNTCSFFVTSTNGVNWSTAATVASPGPTLVSYQRGLFVATGFTNILLTSPDGFTWVDRSPVPKNLYAVTYGHGKFVTVGQRGAILTSDDGVKWNNRSLGTSDSLVGIAAGTEGFVAVGNSSTGRAKVWRSPDAAVWTSQLAPTNTALRAVSYANGLYVAVGQSKPSPSAPYQGAVLTSSNASDWRLWLSGESEYLRGLTYGNGQFVVFGSVVSNGFSTTGVILSSPDGLVWTRRKLAGSASPLAITYGGGRFVAVGEAGLVWTSTDAVNWTLGTTGPNAYWMWGVTYGYDTFVAVSGADYIMNSYDGMEWTKRNSSAFGGKYADLWAVCANSNSFVAVGGDYDPDDSAIVQSGLFSGSLSVRITYQPASVTARAGTNATFRVSAASASPLSYQWRFNNAELPGATNAVLTLTNVQAVHEGVYVVQVADQQEAMLSEPARLTVLVPAEVVHPKPPLNLGVALGETVVLSAQLSGTLPILARWRRFDSNGVLRAIVASQLVGSSQAFLVLTNFNPSLTGTYFLSLSNAFGSGAGILTNAVVTVLPDADGDGLPDAWELTHGLNPGLAADRAFDLDADGMDNLQEYQAGSNPNDPESYLKLEVLAAPPGNADVLLRFTAVSNRTYSIVSQPTVTQGAWTKLADVVASATNRLIEISDPNALVNGTSRFYQLMTPRSP